MAAQQIENKEISSFMTAISPKDHALLRRAAEHLEHPSLAIRLTSILGTPIEIALALLPRNWYKGLHIIAEKAIAKAYDASLISMRHEKILSHESFYKVVGASCGAIGGMFGVLALPIELPVTTAIMLRSISEIARSEGEDLESPDSRAACLEVFALGGRTEVDDAANIGYYGLRLAMAIPVSTAAYHLHRFGLSQQGSTALLDLIATIAPRFGIAITQKSASQLIPAVGAAGSALINVLFIQHFQDMARYHFLIRRLERKYGRDAVEQAYQRYAEMV
jgi:hypothetical protein